MRIVSAQLTNFRCFASKRIELDANLVLLTGNNGIGKTSLLEALHYACYLRSFKTSAPKELINLGEGEERIGGFSVSLTLTDSYSFDDLLVAVSGSKRSLKLNQKQIASYKELYELYKVVTMSEEDLDIVKGAPSVRRAYIDQILSVVDPSTIGLMKKYRIILENRNALLTDGFQGGKVGQESYDLWTNQLLEVARTLQSKRIELLSKLQQEVSLLVSQVFDATYAIELVYTQASYSLEGIEQIEQLRERYPHLQAMEYRAKRSLMGAHLDDITLIFQDKASRSYASRGQQKLIVFLLKLAQLKLFSGPSEPQAIFLIDDFMADFDESKISLLLALIKNWATQVIITSPSEHGFLKEHLTQQGALHIAL